MSLPCCYFQDLWFALPSIYVCLGVDVFEFIPLGVCWVSWIHGYFSLNLVCFLPIISYSFCPFTRFFSGNPIELILLCFMVSHVPEALFILFHCFFLSLPQTWSSQLIYLQVCWFFFSVLFNPSVKCSWSFHLQNFNSLLFHNFSLFSETLFS